jgi:hypothetical protein
MPVRLTTNVPFIFHLSDYFFLEEVINSTQAAKRKLHKIGGAGRRAGAEGAHHASRRQQQKRGRGKSGGREDRWGGRLASYSSVYQYTM